MCESRIPPHSVTVMHCYSICIIKMWITSHLHFQRNQKQFLPFYTETCRAPTFLLIKRKRKNNFVLWFGSSKAVCVCVCARECVDTKYIQAAASIQQSVCLFGIKSTSWLKGTLVALMKPARRPSFPATPASSLSSLMYVTDKFPFAIICWTESWTAH